MRGFVTEKTHAPDGSKTMSQIRREEERLRDTQPMVTSCSIHLCNWTHTGTAAEGRDAFLEHRRVEHPTADRIARNEASRTSDRERAEAAAEERRQQMALRALDEGESQSEVVGREPQADETDAARSDGADARAHEQAPLPSPGPAPAAAEAGSRPRTYRWSRESIVAEIRRLAEELGRPPSISDSPRLAQASARHFGSWGDAVVDAGFPRPTKGTRYKDSSDERAESQSAARGHARLVVDGGSDEQQPPMGARTEEATDEAGPPEPGPAADLATSEEPEQSLTVGAGARQPGSSDADLVLIVGDAIEQAEGVGPELVQRLIGEAERLELRASALRQIAQGVTVFAQTEVRAA